MTQPDLATRHRERASRFAAVIDGVTDWDAPTPVREWSARDVVAHLTSWFPEFLAAGGVTIPVGDPRTPDVSWARQAAAVQALLDDPASAETTFAHPYVPPQSLAGAIDTFYSVDIFMHTWDLARASGQDDNLDEATCTELLTGMQSMADLIRGSGQFGEQQPVADDAPVQHPDLIRGSGQFGEQQPVADDAPVQHRLLAFIGRDPHWRP